jgi:hypothetical protein
MENWDIPSKQPIPLIRFPVLPHKFHPSSTSIKDPGCICQPLTLPLLQKGHVWPELPLFSFSCTTSYLPLNPALGHEFSCELSLCGIFPNMFPFTKWHSSVTHRCGKVYQSTILKETETILFLLLYSGDILKLLRLNTGFHLYVQILLFWGIPAHQILRIAFAILKSWLSWLPWLLRLP